MILARLSQLFGQGDKVPAPCLENFASAFTTLDSASVNCSDSKVRRPAPFLNGWEVQLHLNESISVRYPQ